MKITKQPIKEVKRRLEKLLELQGTRSELRSDKRYINHYKKELILDIIERNLV
jgi:hypothetical protein